MNPGAYQYLMTKSRRRDHLGRYLLIPVVPRPTKPADAGHSRRFSPLFRQRTWVMRVQTGLVLLLCLLACGGCSQQKSTDELIADLKSGTEIEGVKVSRTSPRGKEDAEKVVPAPIEGLTHKGNDVRRSSALKLGEFHEQAKDAIPAL